MDVPEKNDLPKNSEPKVEQYYCSNCKKYLSGAEVDKVVISYKRNQITGKVEPNNDGRFSVFCKECKKYLEIIDPCAEEQRRKMTGEK